MLKFIKTVDSKPDVVDKNDNTIKDFTAKSLVDPNFDIVDFFMCPADFAMRPDLIAELKMGDASKLKILLKANDISNPYTIEEGDVLIIPDPILSESKFTATASATDMGTIIRKQYIDPKKAIIQNTGDSLSAYLEREKTSLPPNYAKTGDTEMLFANGKIILGPNVTRPTEKVTEYDIPIAKQKLIQKIKQNGR